MVLQKSSHGFDSCGWPVSMIQEQTPAQALLERSHNQ